MTAPLHRLLLLLPLLLFPHLPATTANESSSSAPSSELTPREEGQWRAAILSAANAHADLEQPLQTLTATLEQRIRDLGTFQTQLHTIQDHLERIQELQSTLTKEEWETQIPPRIQEFYKGQIQQLQSRLQTSLQHELHRRSAEESKEASKKDANETSFSPKKDKVSLHELHTMLSVTPIAQSAHESLISLFERYLWEEWDSKSQKVDLIVEDYQQKVLEKEEELETLVRSVQQQQQQVGSSQSDSCMDTIQAAKVVYSTVLEQEEMETQLEQESQSILEGMTIVYGPQWTSDTYAPPPPSKQSIQPMPLGQSTLRSYIPQDWERWFPTGWEEWDIAPFLSMAFSPTAYLPPFVVHSLPHVLTSMIYSLTGSTTSASPETIFDSNIQLGHCWPFAGSSGKVTLRLARPMMVTGVTIRHAAMMREGVPSSSSNKWYNHGTSAPKSISVVGYPSCEDGDEECEDLGFDSAKSLELSNFEYQLQSSDAQEESSSSFKFERSSQTFDFGGMVGTESPVGVGDKESKMYQDDMDGFDLNSSSSSGSCSAIEASSCGGIEEEMHEEGNLGETAVQALTIHVEDNWGNEDYTCIYHVHVHGKEITSE